MMPSDIPLKQRRWLGLQMLEGDIYSRAYAGEASRIWMPPSPVCVMRWTIRRCTLPMRVTSAFLPSVMW
ncbi:hypothetical protein DMI65_01415 [Escherichia coli]|nr:hypothetical protein [Escherichia coli]